MAFASCPNLTQIVSTGSTTPWTAINSYAFSECYNLTRIEFFSWTGTISSIDSDAFDDCGQTGQVKGTNALDFINQVKEKGAMNEVPWFTNWTVAQ
jgi:hypothetical protein